MRQLAEHLARQYAVQVVDLEMLDVHVYRVHGPGWVARRFPERTHTAAQATADILRRLGPTGFPAERLAADPAVTDVDGHPVLVTEFVEGRRAPGTPSMFAALGAYLGALHQHTGTDLAPGGGWHHLVPQGTPREEIVAADALLSATAGDRAALGTLRAELANLDDCADLPHAVVHPDFVPQNALLRPAGGMVIVDWSGAGRGPRLWSLGFLLWVAGASELGLVDQVAERYRQRIQLTAAELDRLVDAVRGRQLTLDCWSVAHGRLDAAQGVQRLDENEQRAHEIAARARSVLSG